VCWCCWFLRLSPKLNKNLRLPGDPDLQGIWSNQTPVPLDRLGEKAFFTKDEVAEFERTALQRLLDPNSPIAAVMSRFRLIRAGPHIERQLTIIIRPFVYNGV